MSLAADRMVGLVGGAVALLEATTLDVAEADDIGNQSDTGALRKAFDGPASEEG